MSASQTISRRDFLVLTQAASAGLLLGAYWPASTVHAQQGAGASFQPNPFLQVAPNGAVTIWAPRPDMGEGTYTSLPMLVAEELDVEWSTIKIVQAGYGPQYGTQQLGGSNSIRSSYLPLRQAGAAAREMLVTAAAQRWGVDVSSCRAEKGFVLHTASGRLSYGELASAAANLPVPKEPKLKDATAFTLIGKPTPRVDVPSKVDGSAVFGMDIRVPGMLYAVIARPPVFGAEIESVDDSKAKAVPGVKQVIRLSRAHLVGMGATDPPGPGATYYVQPGVAVVADSTWAATRGRDALAIRWQEGPGASISSASLREEMQRLVAGSPLKQLRNDGNIDQALAGAAKTLEAEYELPFLAHATMEPLVATAHVTDGACEAWVPTQNPAHAAQALAAALKIPLENVKVHVAFLGGGFGRKFQADFAVEAALVSKAVGVPVKLVFTRDDDTRRGFFRQLSYHKMAAALDADGKPVAWRHYMVSTPLRSTFTGTDDSKETFGTEIAPTDFPCHTIPNFRIDYTPCHTIVPRGFWRSVGGSMNGFVNSAFFDELAAAAGKDPVELYRQLIGDKSKMEGSPLDLARLKGVIDLVASKSGWGTPLPSGQSRGIGVGFDFSTYAAEVAEVSVAPGGRVRVHRVVCAVDIGTVVNPQTVVQQVEGSVMFGLSQTLLSEITLKDGRVEQGNFDRYQVLRINQAPKVEVYIVPSTAPPTGIGEPAVPPVAGAVANAIFAATGKRIRRLPIRPADLA